MPLVWGTANECPMMFPYLSGRDTLVYLLVSYLPSERLRNRIARWYLWGM